MKKGILKITTLTLLIALGSVACSTSKEVADDSTTPDSTPSASGTPSTPTPATPSTPTAESPSPATPEALPALPPPVSVEAELEKAHLAYAAYAGVSSLGVKMLWEEKMKGVSPFAVTNITYLNNFFDFIYQVDPTVRSRFSHYANEYIKYVKINLASGEKEDLIASVKYLAVQNEIIKARILKAAQIYGISLVDMEAKGPDRDMFNSAARDFYQPVFTSIGWDGDLQNQLTNLFGTITMVYQTSSGNKALIGFEKFSGKALIKPFEGDEGGFGAVDPFSVRLVE